MTHSPEHTDGMYNYLLNDLLSLSPEHRADLLSRGITDDEIAYNLYRTMPRDRRHELADGIALKFGIDQCLSLPGICKDDSERLTLAGPTGLIVSCRNVDGRIVALKVRTVFSDDSGNRCKRYTYLSSKNHGGNGPGAPVHVARLRGLPTGTIRVTEGEIKANVATDLSGILTISVPGAQSWRQAIPVLDELGCRHVLIAFDADVWTNGSVAASLKGLYDALVAAGRAVEIEIWDAAAGKGIDDVLAAGKADAIRRLSGDDAQTWVERALAEAREAERVEREAKKQAENVRHFDFVNAAVARSKVSGDPGIVCGPDVLDSMRHLYQRDPAGYTRICKVVKDQKIGIGKTDLEKRVKQAVKESQQRENDYSVNAEQPDKFEVIDNETYFNGLDRRGLPSRQKLANFSAKIAYLEVLDDGTKHRTKHFVIQGTNVTGKTLEPLKVGTDEFKGLNWVMSGWENDAIIDSGPNVIDRLREAIQTLSESPTPRRTSHTHLGWMKSVDEWVFLHFGGAIGARGVVDRLNVSIDHHFNLYELPPPPTGADLTVAAQASLSLLKLLPREKSYAYLAAIYRAPLCDALPVDFTVTLFGETGTCKSQIAALAMNHFGRGFTGLRLPGNWSSSENSIEKLSFVTKDCPLVVDDLAPEGSPNDIAGLYKKAARLYRGQGNNAGRGRLHGDGRLREDFYPRGQLWVTCEELARGRSIRARSYIIELKQGDIENLKLAHAQTLAADGALARSMSGFIAWLAPQMDELKESLPKRLQEMRAQTTNVSSPHRRTSDIAINLGLSLEKMLRFMVYAGAITEDEAADHWNQGWAVLVADVERQAEHQMAEDAVEKALPLLASAIVSGNAYIASASDEQAPKGEEVRWGYRKVTRGSGPYEAYSWEPRGGNLIGWVGDRELWLERGAAFAVIQKMAHDQGMTFPTEQTTLWKRLAERGLTLWEAGEHPRPMVKRQPPKRPEMRVVVFKDKATVWRFGGSDERKTENELGSVGDGASASASNLTDSPNSPSSPTLDGSDARWSEGEKCSDDEIKCPF